MRRPASRWPPVRPAPVAVPPAVQRAATSAAASAAAPIVGRRLGSRRRPRRSAAVSGRRHHDRRSGVGEAGPGLRHRRPRRPVVQRPGRRQPGQGQGRRRRRRRRADRRRRASPTRPRSTGSTSCRQRRHRHHRASASPTPAPLKEVAAANPDVNFAIVDDDSLAAVPNVASLTFAEEQGSYLVGVAAGKKTKTNKVGFIGGVNVPLIQKFQAGFEAGVKAANPDATVTASTSPSRRTSAGFNAPAAGRDHRHGHVQRRHRHHLSPRPAAPVPACSRRPRPPATSASASTPTSTTSPTLADVKDVIITSMLKKVDVATYDFITSAVNGDAAHRRAQVQPEQQRRRLLHLGRQDRRHRPATWRRRRQRSSPGPSRFRRRTS